MGTIHRRPKSGGRRGTTLLELVIYIGVVSFILLGVTAFAMDFLAAKSKATAVQEVARNGRFALAVIAAEIREATTVNTGSSTFGTSSGTLSLAKSNVPTADPTIFTLSGGTLTVKRGSGSVLPLTNSKVNVSELTFENLSPNGKTWVIRVHLRLVSNDTSVTGQLTDRVYETTERVRTNDGYSN